MSVRLTEARLRQIIREEAAGLARRRGLSEAAFSGRLGAAQSMRRGRPGPGPVDAGRLADLESRVEDFAMDSSLFDDAVESGDSYQASQEIVDSYLSFEGVAGRVPEEWREELVFQVAAMIDGRHEDGEFWDQG